MHCNSRGAGMSKIWWGKTSIREEILYSILAVSDQGSLAKPLWYWCSFSPRQALLSHLHQCLCFTKVFLSHIGCKRKMKVDQAHCSTHCGPTSTLSTWPSEQRLLFFMIFVEVHEFSSRLTTFSSCRR
jgi:hypothetical protein